MIIPGKPEKNANQNNTSQNQNNSELKVEQAEAILNEKFRKLEKLYLNPDTYFNLENIETEQGRRILDYDQKLKSDFTANMIKKVEKNIYQKKF